MQIDSGKEFQTHKNGNVRLAGQAVMAVSRSSAIIIKLQCNITMENN